MGLYPAVTLLSGLTCLGALFRTSVSGVFFWLLALLALWFVSRATAPLPSANGRLWLVALIPIAVNVASVLVFRLEPRAASWWPLLGLPLIAGLPLRPGEGVRILIRVAVAGSWTALAIQLLAAMAPEAVADIVTVNPILFGQVAVWSALVCAVARPRDGTGLSRAALFAAMLAGLAGAIIAGYRGGLLVLPLLLLACLRDGPPLRRGQALAAAGFATLVIVIAIVASPMLERIGDAFDETVAFTTGAIDFSSVGTRLALWQLAGELFAANPLFGVGAGRFDDAMVAIARAGRLPADLEVFSHAHSSALNLAAEYGIVGVGAVALAVVMLWRHAGWLEPRAGEMVRYGLGCWLILSLTNDVFAHQSSLRVMTLGLALGCAGAVRRPAPTPHKPGESGWTR